MYKQRFSRTVVSVFAAAFLIAPSAFADHHGNGFDHLTAAKAAADFCAGKVKSEALVAEALSKAKALFELNAFITLDERGFLLCART